MITEHEIYSDGERRVIVVQELVTVRAQTGNCAQLVVRLAPTTVRVEGHDGIETYDLDTRATEADPGPG